MSIAALSLPEPGFSRPFRRIPFRMNLRIFAGAFLLLIAGLFAAGWLTRQDPAEKPYLHILGGGFIFNYRVAEVFYGFTLVVEKPVTAGSIIEAEFENPEGGPPFIVEQRTNARTTRYALHSPNLRGVEAGKPYHVVIRLYDFRHEKLLERQERAYTSQTSSDIVPDKPLTVGPGYWLNPDNPEQR